MTEQNAPRSGQVEVDRQSTTRTAQVEPLLAPSHRSEDHHIRGYN